MEFGERLRRVRKKRKINQSDLAERAGICETSIREYEVGKRMPNAYNLKKICEELRVSADYLLGLK